VTVRFSVRVNSDQFDKLARRTQPVPAVAELIWNGLDAEARHVRVEIEPNDLGGVVAIVVRDDGHGMSNSDAKRDFEFLGGSWKKTSVMTRGGLRVLHGKQGEGRFRAFALGSEVTWDTTARNVLGELERTTILGSLASSDFVLSDPETSAGPTGTQVIIREPREYAGQLLGEMAPIQLVATFALYLLRYEDVTITFDGTRLDPRTILEREEEIELPEAVGGSRGPALLRVLEWKATAKSLRPALFLCGDGGVVLYELKDVDAPEGTRYSAYVVWPGFSAFAQDIALAELGHQEMGPVVEAARLALREYLEERRRDRRAELIGRWKAQQVYPYAVAPKTAAELQERRLFDAVAVTASSGVGKDPKTAKLSLRLLKEALESSPGSLHRVLREVLVLTPEQLADFDRLLERTNLASIIQVSKAVTDRLDFLSDLESLLFDKGKRERLLERSQLHKILENSRTWVFGEDYALALSDKGLTKVLQAHQEILGHDVTGEPVLGPDGKPLIVDLLLSRAAHGPTNRQHLVVELKRPKVPLTMTEVSQLAKYGAAVAGDPRFLTPEVSWDFYLVGDEVDATVSGLIHQPNNPPGLFGRPGNHRIWVRTWSEILEENRQRLHFYRDHLQYEEPEDEGLNETLLRYLPDTDEVAKG